MTDLKEKQYLNSSNYRSRIFLHYKFSSNKYSWPLWVFDNIVKTDNAEVLEIGCGNGLLWILNAGRVPGNWKITLTDFSEGMLKDAENSIGTAVPGINYRVMDAGEIPYSDGSFDIIIANHMLYHLPDRGKALSEIRRVLKDNGTFYTTTMEHDYMGEMSDIVREYRSVPLSGKSGNGVIQNFSLKNGEEQLKEYFNNVELEIYENSLNITEAAPFTDYAVSLNSIVPGRVVIDESERERFTAFIQDRINREGRIFISANAGIFICRK